VPTRSDEAVLAGTAARRTPESFRRGGLLARLPVAFLLVAGCGRPPQVASQNRELITSLATAVSAKNAQWLESNSRLIEKRRTDGQISDADYGTLTAVVAKARAGDWTGAERDVYALRDAQEPTAEDFQNLAERKRAPEHQAPKKVVKAPARGRPPR